MMGLKDPVDFVEDDEPQPFWEKLQRLPRLLADLLSNAEGIPKSQNDCPNLPRQF